MSAKAAYAQPREGCQQAPHFKQRSKRSFEQADGIMFASLGNDVMYTPQLMRMKRTAAPTAAADLDLRSIAGRTEMTITAQPISFANIADIPVRWRLLQTDKTWIASARWLLGQLSVLQRKMTQCVHTVRDMFPEGETLCLRFRNCRSALFSCFECLLRL